MLATLSLVIRHEALARRGETIYRKAPPCIPREGPIFTVNRDIWEKRQVAYTLLSKPLAQERPTPKPQIAMLLFSLCSSSEIRIGIVDDIVLP